MGKEKNYCSPRGGGGKLKKKREIEERTAAYKTPLFLYPSSS